MGSSRDTSEYRKKRHFRRTPEPGGEMAGSKSKKKGESPLFVIQHHDASTDHFDFRLEVDGVLKSWAVPKGPSTDPREKRLAVETEDHPLDYADFEGVIPEGEYGGGTVLVWDRGTYRGLDEQRSVAEGLDDGKASFWLDGEKIRGGYHLVRTRMQGDKQQWLLMKADDDEADARRNPTSTEPKSVLSGRTLSEIEEEESGESE